MIDILADVVVHPLLIEMRVAPTYCCLIDEHCSDIMTFIGLLDLTYIMKLQRL